jgi:hypothetical protein
VTFVLSPSWRKAHEVTQLDLVIALVGAGAKLHFLDDDLLLFELRFVPLLALTVLELSVIHDAAHRRHRRRCNFDQIELGLFGHLVGAGETDHPDLFTARADQANFGCGDLAVDPGFLFLSYATLLPCSFI